MKKGAMGRERVARPPAGDHGETVAVRALSFMAADPDRLEAFLGQTGLHPTTLREAARSPTFLESVLDHVMSDESLLVAFAAGEGMDPEAVVRAHRELTRGSRRADEEP